MNNWDSEQSDPISDIKKAMKVLANQSSSEATYASYARNEFSLMLYCERAVKNIVDTRFQRWVWRMLTTTNTDPWSIRLHRLFLILKSYPEYWKKEKISDGSNTRIR